MNFWSLKVLILLVGISNLTPNEFLAQSDALVAYNYEMVLENASKKLQRRIGHKLLNSSNYERELEQVKSQLFSEGYLTPILNLDTIEDKIILNIDASKRYKWTNLNLDEDSKGILRKSNINIDRISGKIISQKQFRFLRERPLTYLENHGFPFAKVFLDSVIFHDQGLEANYILDKGPFVVIDSVVLKGDLLVREAFITNYLGIKEGSAYNERAVKEISSRLSEVAFVDERQKPLVYFNRDQTKILLFLNKRGASRFDGIIGFLPNAEGEGLTVTGDAKVHLENALKQGETIDLQWRRLQSNTQDFRLELIAPYLINSPLTADVVGSIYRRDTLFTDVNGELGFRYMIKRNNYLRAFIANKSTSLISTSQYQNSISPPEFLDRTITNYGLGFRLTRVDYRLNPSKGYDIQIQAAAGNRRIKKNILLPELLYENLELTSVQITSSLNAAYYWSLVKRLVWHQQLLGVSLVNNQLFNNDAERIGGLQTLRGFNEQEIFATSYFILRNELRFQLEKDGYVFGFFDGAWYENKSFDPLGAKRDTPYGFGAGLTFGTRAGIFSISYALGSQLSNPILLRTNKVHFGFVSVF